MTLTTDDIPRLENACIGDYLIVRALFRKTKQDQILKNTKNQARILSFYEIGNFPLQYVTLLRFLAMVHCTMRIVGHGFPSFFVITSKQHQPVFSLFLVMGRFDQFFY